MFEVGSYRYQCIDHSLLDPYLRRFCATPLHKRIPRWIPANCISLLGHLCVWMVFLLSTHQSSALLVCGVISLLLFYMVLDVLDGMQARVSKTSSPLGEYIDHGGDAYNCGLIIYSSLSLLQVTAPWFYYVLIGFGMIIFSLVSIEKKITGFCVFPKIGNVELQSFLIVFLAVLQIPLVGKSLALDFGGFSIATWILLVIALVGGIMSIMTSVRRIASLPAPYYLFLMLSGLLVMTLITQALSLTLSSIILIFFMATYNSELLFSHLDKHQMPWPDWISGLVIVIFVVSCCFEWSLPNDFFYAFLAYLILRSMLSVRRVFNHYGRFWVWINPSSNILG